MDDKQPPSPMHFFVVSGSHNWVIAVSCCSVPCSAVLRLLHQVVALFLVLQVSSDADALLQQARAADLESPEPLQALASLRYELGSAEEAVQLLRESMALWFKPQPGSGEDVESDDAEDVESISDAAEVCLCHVLWAVAVHDSTKHRHPKLLHSLGTSIAQIEDRDEHVTPMSECMPAAHMHCTNTTQFMSF